MYLNLKKWKNIVNLTAFKWMAFKNARFNWIASLLKSVTYMLSTSAISCNYLKKVLQVIINTYVGLINCVINIPSCQVKVFFNVVASLWLNEREREREKKENIFFERRDNLALGKDIVYSHISFGIKNKVVFVLLTDDVVDSWCMMYNFFAGNGNAVFFF